MNQIAAIFMNRARLEKAPRYRITEQNPVFSWAWHRASLRRGAESLFSAGTLRCAGALEYGMGGNRPAGDGL